MVTCKCGRKIPDSVSVAAKKDANGNIYCVNCSKSIKPKQLDFLDKLKDNFSID